MVRSQKKIKTKKGSMHVACLYIYIPIHHYTSCTTSGSSARRYYPPPEQADRRCPILWKHTRGSIKNLYPYIRCPVTPHKVTFWIWNTIERHCGSRENLAASRWATGWRGDPPPPPTTPTPPHRSSVDDNTYETDPAYVWDPFKWDILWKFIVSPITGSPVLSSSNC